MTTKYTSRAKATARTVRKWRVGITPGDTLFIHNGKRAIASLHGSGMSAEKNAAVARLMAGAPELRRASQQLYDAVQEYLMGISDKKLPRYLLHAFDTMEIAWRKADGTRLDLDIETLIEATEYSP